MTWNIAVDGISAGLVYGEANGLALPGLNIARVDLLFLAFDRPAMFDASRVSHSESRWLVGLHGDVCRIKLVLTRYHSHRLLSSTASATACRYQHQGHGGDSWPQGR